jgi:hypothetical protein
MVEKLWTKNDARELGELAFRNMGYKKNQQVTVMSEDEIFDLFKEGFQLAKHKQKRGR